jgi:DNA mismatch repair protein MSH6
VENTDGKLTGTLLAYLDNCVTPFGKRELKRWILAPLTDIP